MLQVQILRRRPIGTPVDKLLEEQVADVRQSEEHHGSARATRDYLKDVKGFLALVAVYAETVGARSSVG